MAERRPLRFGIVGLGRAGGGIVSALARHPLARITAGADIRREPREALADAFDAEVYERAEDLCASPSVDVVVVATPHQCHTENVIAAAERHKHVVVEKPMALTLEDCDVMLAACERYGVHVLVGRGSHGFDAPVLKIREIVASGELGRLGMVNTWNYNDFLYRPRRPEELDTSQGGGIIFNQVPHQVDIVRVIGGGLVRSVRSMTGVWDPQRPTEGSHATFLEFEDGAAATICYNGYDRFDSAEFHFGIDEGGNMSAPSRHGESRRALRAVGSAEDEAAAKAATGFGGPRERERGGRAGERHHPHFGVLLVSCMGGDLRPSPDGVYVYDDNGMREIDVPFPTRAAYVDEIYDAVTADQPIRRDGRWGKANLEVCLAILQSARERREVKLAHQVPFRDS